MVQPFIDFERCAEWVMRGELGGQAAYVTGAIQKASALDSTDLGNVADAVAGWFVTTLSPLVHNLLTVNDIKVTDLTSQFAGTFVGGSGLPANGAVTGDIVPNNVALVVNFPTARRGRAFRGRAYMPAMPANTLATSTSFTSTAANAIANAFSTLHLSLAGAGYLPVILSRQENGARRIHGVATPVLNQIGRTPVGTQRRRVIGHGI